jgi:hypothetical protein
VGWEERAFHASAYQAHQGPIAEAAVIWSPSGMTTVTAKLTRGIEDAAQEGIAGYTYTAGRLAVDHEYMRNVLLQGTVALQHANYLPGGGTTSAVSVGAGVTWLVNRHVRVVAQYEFTDQRGNNPPGTLITGNYTQSVGLLTLRLGM